MIGCRHQDSPIATEHHSPSLAAGLKLPLPRVPVQAEDPPAFPALALVALFVENYAEMDGAIIAESAIRRPVHSGQDLRNRILVEHPAIERELDVRTAGGRKPADTVTGYDETGCQSRMEPDEVWNVDTGRGADLFSFPVESPNDVTLGLELPLLRRRRFSSGEPDRPVRRQRGRFRK